jgi:hypothetical protein
MRTVPDWRGRISRRPTESNTPDKAVMRGDLSPAPEESANVKAVSVLVGFGQVVGDARRVDQVTGAIRAGG